MIASSLLKEHRKRILKEQEEEFSRVAKILAEKILQKLQEGNVSLWYEQIICCHLEFAFNESPFKEIYRLHLDKKKLMEFVSQLLGIKIKDLDANGPLLDGKTYYITVSMDDK